MHNSKSNYQILYKYYKYCWILPTQENQKYNITTYQYKNLHKADREPRWFVRHLLKAVVGTIYTRRLASWALFAVVERYRNLNLDQNSDNARLLIPRWVAEWERIICWWQDDDANTHTTKSAQFASLLV